MPRCAVLLDDGVTTCGSGCHCVTRPTRGGPDAVVCYGHQRQLRVGVLLRTRRAVIFLPQASRVRARIMRGG